MNRFRSAALAGMLGALAALTMTHATPARAVVDDVVLVDDTNALLGLPDVLDVHRRPGFGLFNATYLDVLGNDDLGGLASPDVEVRNAGLFGSVEWDPHAKRVLVSELSAPDEEVTSGAFEYRVCDSGNCSAWARVTLTYRDLRGGYTAPVPSTTPTRQGAFDCGPSDCGLGVLGRIDAGEEITVRIDTRLLTGFATEPLTLTNQSLLAVFAPDNGPAARPQPRYDFDAESGMLVVTLPADAGLLDDTGEWIRPGDFASILNGDRCAGTTVTLAEMPAATVAGPSGLSVRTATPGDLTVTLGVDDCTTRGTDNPRPPTARADSASGLYSQSIVIPVLANDTFRGHASVKVVRGSLPARVKTSVDASGRIVVVVPKAEAGKPVRFSYRLTEDRSGLTATARVIVTTSPVVVTSQQVREVPKVTPDVEKVSAAKVPTEQRFSIGRSIVFGLGALLVGTSAAGLIRNRRSVR